MKNINLKNQKGFTLLFATLVAALILSVGIAIANITLLQIVLSAAGKESQSAFYYADSGIECALYYEYNVPRADKSLFFSSSQDIEVGKTITCEGKDADVDFESSGSGTTANATTTFSINPPGPGCVADEPSYVVKVGKAYKDAYSSFVNIESRGYNTCNTASLRRVERGLYVKLID